MPVDQWHPSAVAGRRDLSSKAVGAVSDDDIGPHPMLHTGTRGSLVDAGKSKLLDLEWFWVGIGVLQHLAPNRGEQKPSGECSMTCFSFTPFRHDLVNSHTTFYCKI